MSRRAARRAARELACRHQQARGLGSADGTWACAAAPPSPAAVDACATTLAGHTGGVTALAVLLDGCLASGSWDGAVRVWA